MTDTENRNLNEQMEEDIIGTDTEESQIDEISEIRKEIAEAQEDDVEPEGTEDENQEGDWLQEFFQNTFITNFKRRRKYIEKYINGIFSFEVSDKKVKYIYDFTQQEPLIKDGSNIDVKIKTNEDTARALIRGRLNPQMALLSGAVSISGDIHKGIYFFNNF